MFNLSDENEENILTSKRIFDICIEHYIYNSVDVIDSFIIDLILSMKTYLKLFSGFRIIIFSYLVSYIMIEITSVNIRSFT